MGDRGYSAFQNFFFYIPEMADNCAEYILWGVTMRTSVAEENWVLPFCDVRAVAEGQPSDDALESEETKNYGGYPMETY